MSRTDHHQRVPLEQRDEPKPNPRLTARKARHRSRTAMQRGQYDTLPAYQSTRG